MRRAKRASLSEVVPFQKTAESLAVSKHPDGTILDQVEVVGLVLAEHPAPVRSAVLAT